MAMEFELSGPDVNFIESHNAIAGWLARRKKLPLKGRKRKKEGSLLEKRDSLDRRRVKRIMFFYGTVFYSGRARSNSDISIHFRELY